MAVTSLTPQLQNRLTAIATVLSDEPQQLGQKFETAFTNAQGDINKTIADLSSNNVGETDLKKLSLAHAVAGIANNDATVVKSVAALDNVSSLRDLALNHSSQSLAEAIKPHLSNNGVAENELHTIAEATATATMKNLFHEETSAVLQRMATSNELPIKNDTVKTGMVSFLNNQPEFNIRTTSIYDALKNQNALKDIDPEHQGEVIQNMKTLQRVQAVSPDAPTVSNLLSTNLRSAHQITEMPEKNFVKTYGDKLGQDTAKLVYANAAKIRTRNEVVLGQLKDAGTSTNIRVLSNGLSQDKLTEAFDEATSKAGVNLSWETLFGSTDLCECGDCNSVYSPAAYFVELLQYLRNNNLSSPGSATDITGTVLEKFFFRRPDLGCLELTCENVNTVLPYVDLVNEVLESFIVHTHNNPSYAVETKNKAIDIQNTEDETSSELLAQPQHTKYEAYSILQNEVYPFTLPYHQPIDAIRTFLNSLNTSRCELMNTFRSVPMNMPAPSAGNPPFTATQTAQLTQFIKDGLRHAVGAEYLSITEEEYSILTKNAFLAKGYYDIVNNKTFSTTEYESNIGVKELPAYYGYTGNTAEDDMNNQHDPTVGLKFVKKQFLKRTGVLYTDLITILKTQFINPGYPQGKSLTILEGLRFSYSYLQTFVTNDNDPDPEKKYASLISILQQPIPAIGWFSEMLNPDLCQQNNTENTIDADDLKKWVYFDFKKIGKLIILEGNDKPYFPITGFIYASPLFETPFITHVEKIFIGSINESGTIIDPLNSPIGKVNPTDGSISYISSNSDVLPGTEQTYFDIFNSTESFYFITIFDEKLPEPTHPVNLGVKVIGSIVADRERQKSFIYSANSQAPVQFLPTPDSCDITKVVLHHLDGTPLDDCEWDRIHRFIRLWRKLGWTINETDKAIMALGCEPSFQDNSPSSSPTETQGSITAFSGTDNNSDGDGSDTTPDNKNCNNCDISANFLQQVVYVKKLADSTGLELIKLLTFWNDISTYGDKKTPSLYARLFLTANMIGVDKVFKVDSNGNYLTTSEKITDHIPVLMAALNLKAQDITNILAIAAIDPKASGSLSLNNVSLLYRYGLLMRILNVKSYQISAIVSPTLYGNPFTSARTTFKFLEKWGRMTDAGFNYAQLNYCINGQDDSIKPLTPKLKTILQLAKNIYDGLNQIDADADIIDLENAESINDELIRKGLSKLYTTPVVEQIISFLDGSSVYTTNAPLITNPLKQAAFDLALASNPDLKRRIKYDYNKGLLQLSGILTPSQLAIATTLSTDSNWPDALQRSDNQAVLFYNDMLDSIFQSPYLPGTDQPANARTKLVAGDDSTPTSASTEADEKRQYFATVFIPYLKQKLYVQFLIGILSDAFSTRKDVVSSLIQYILIDSTSNQPNIETFSAIKNKPAAGAVGWSGYLIPNADDVYTFVITGNPDGTKPVNSFTLDGISYPISLNPQGDPSNRWFSDPIKLMGGKPYVFIVNGLPADMSAVQWKTPTSPTSAIPTSVLLPDSSDNVKKAYIQLQKATIIINGFGLKGDEVEYLQKNGVDFDGLDFNHFLVKPFFRLEAYWRLKKSLPTTDTSLLSFFNWAKTPGSNASELSKKINELTHWVPSDAPSPNDLDKLIATNQFNLSLTDFVNEKKLLKLQHALYVAGKISMDIDVLFNWALPTSNFLDCHAIAESIQNTMKARYKETDWEQVVKPLNDKLRVTMRDALVSYLLVDPRLVDWGVVDADSLFEFFLIDTQMDSCMETSRIKQAINSVQLFVQRCFLGIEETQGVTSDQLDRHRWNWMQREVLWVANRKVFLYPENWIKESLRDDKSPFYKELESALLQKDINPQTVQDALKTYLYNLDEVANMKVVGLYVETKDTNAHNRIHVFSRTRNAPYFFYYRYYDMDDAIWTAWEKVQVDIPSYDLEDSNTYQITENGCYLIPAVFNNRLLIFFPQITKKTRPNPKASTGTFQDLGNSKSGIKDSKPIELWEIKMAWSEYRNGKWTQKQLSKEAIYVDGEALPIPNVNEFCFFVTIDNGLNIQVLYSTTFISMGGDAFKFSGNNIVYPGKVVADFSDISTDFNYDSSSNLKILQKPSPSAFGINSDSINFNENSASIEIEKINSSTTQTSFLLFSHLYSHQLLGKINANDLVEFFECIPNTPANPVSKTNTTPNTADINLMFGGAIDTTTHNPYFDELAMPYSIYNWELFFHLPLTIAESLSKSQQFETAMQWYNYIFNPVIDKGTDDKRWWRFVPFQNTDAKEYLTVLFNSLKPNTPDTQISQWRDNPFSPHAIARLRPSAYMKKTVMSYLDNLIAWGDYLFTQHTIESINQATQLYVFASHILGQRPEIIPKRGKIRPETYNSLLDKWDAFSNAVVELELVFPFSNQIADASELNPSDGKQVYPNIFGFASSLYFCMPSNPELIAYWNTIDDRLYKIRHCENIEGVFSLPPLWDPPIDPALLVQATAAGLSLDSVLNDLSSPLPNYRFNYLVSKALELCNELKSMGNSLLSVFEKKDGEALAKMRARHEVTLNNLVMEIKKKQVDEANAALEGLNQNRLGPAYRMQHYLSLLGEDLGKIPNTDTDFSPLADTIETISGDSGLKLIPYEKEEMDKASEAQVIQTGVGIIETLASIFHGLPTIQTDIKPIGVGVGISWGFPNLANAISSVGRSLQIIASDLSFQSSQAQRKAGFLRQMQDRVLQANTAGYEIKQIDKQILTQQIRIDIANQEKNNQLQMIDKSNEVLEFLTDKYTNEELYGWMQDNIKSLYYQVYKLGYDLAKKAEMVYRFDRGLTNSSFIQFGYWDASRDGLLAGERLYLGIKQLEAAYQEKRGYDYEITKHISLRQINPLALLQLRENGTCDFELPEILFDMDFPGHYLRKIKSVGLSIPCIVGPYAGVNATLKITANKFRMNALVNANNYAETTDQQDTRFQTVNVPIAGIATSSAQNDSGVFELNFKDERYMPFEGAGAISNWSLALSTDFRQFDYESITDVIIHMHYTSVEGGQALAAAATKSLKNYLQNIEILSADEGLFVIFDLKHDYPNEWYKNFDVSPVATNRVFSLGNLQPRLPFFTNTFTISVTDIFLATSPEIKKGDLTFVNNGNVLPQFGGPVPHDAITLFQLNGLRENISNWSIKVADTAQSPSTLWVILRYSLGPPK